MLWSVRAVILTVKIQFTPFGAALFLGQFGRLICLQKKNLKYKFSSFADLLDMSFKFKEETDLNLLAVLFW